VPDQAFREAIVFSGDVPDELLTRIQPRLG